MKKLLLPAEYGVLYACEAGEKGQEQHDAAHAMLREVLKQEKGLCNAPKIARTIVGKPYFPEYPELHFNISHCRGLAVVLLSDRECGVDAERRRPLREKIVNRVFSPEEQAALTASDDPDMLFTRLWTLKESYVKAIGIGVSYPLQEVTFALHGDAVQSNRQDAVFFHMTMEDYAISVCCLTNGSCKE